jgi:hypothetical protein
MNTRTEANHEWVLAKGDETTLLEMLENDSAGTCLLILLACHRSERIRAAVADNPRTPYLGLVRLALDESADIRFQVAENHNVPVTILKLLAEDENPYVSERALRTIERIETFQTMAIACH